MIVMMILTSYPVVYIKFKIRIKVKVLVRIHIIIIAIYRIVHLKIKLEESCKREFVLRKKVKVMEKEIAYLKKAAEKSTTAAAAPPAGS